LGTAVHEVTPPAGWASTETWEVAPQQAEPKPGAHEAKRGAEPVVCNEVEKPGGALLTPGDVIEDVVRRLHATCIRHGPPPRVHPSRVGAGGRGTGERGGKRAWSLPLPLPPAQRPGDRLPSLRGQERSVDGLEAVVVVPREEQGGETPPFLSVPRGGGFPLLF